MRKNSTHYYLTNPKILADPDISKDIIQTNPLLYNMSFNPFSKTHSEMVPLDNEKLQYLKEIAFNKDRIIQKNKNTSKVTFLMKLKTKKINEKLNFGQSKKQPVPPKNNLDTDDSIMKNNPISFFQKYSENPDDLRKNGNFDLINLFFLYNR